MASGTWVVYPWYRDKSPTSPRSTAVLTITAVLIGLGLLGTFPIFFQLFAAE